jgi:tRNA A-37 threonylcarbamoyl transferase component Bud32
MPAAADVAVEIEVRDSCSAAAPRGRVLLPAPDAAQVVKQEDRTLIWRARLDDGTRAFVKLYRHRPPRRWYRSLEAFKVLVRREFDNLRAVAAHGIPCTRPLFWAEGASAAHGRFEVLATEEIAGAASIRDLRRAGTDLDGVAWPELFDVVARMHRTGVFHCCLSTKNVLLDEGSRVHLADFSKSMHFPFDVSGTRMARYDLAYLLRGLVPILGEERARELVGAASGDADLARRVVARSATLEARNGLQHKRHRVEFLTRYLLATGRTRSGPD